MKAPTTSLLALAIFLATYPQIASPQESPSLPDIEEEQVEASPKEGWDELPSDDGSEDPSGARIALLWIPNRVLDLIDVFRVDLGAGVAMGGVIRVTRYGQVGFRTMAPASLRVGDFGRRSPILLETSNEFGVGPAYVNSADREICKAEVGLGLDLLIGGYAGLCLDEAADFFGGIFLIDFMDDDLE